jgi:hypothetical protein
MPTKSKKCSARNFAQINRTKIRKPEVYRIFKQSIQCDQKKHVVYGLFRINSANLAAVKKVCLLLLDKLKMVSNEI